MVTEIQAKCVNEFIALNLTGFLKVGFFYSLAFVYPDISQNGPKMILFESYQGERGASYSFRSFSAFAIYTCYVN